MGISVWQLVIILIVILIIFGAGKLPKVMSDIGKGINSMKEGLKGEEENSGKKRAGKKKSGKKKSS